MDLSITNFIMRVLTLVHGKFILVGYAVKVGQ